MDPKQEQQEELEKKDVKSPGKYPEAAGDTDKDVPKGTWPNTVRFEKSVKKSGGECLPTFL